ncbi:MAG: hypothetical protein ACLFVB_09755 [Thermoplasmata archaeon]
MSFKHVFVVIIAVLLISSITAVQVVSAKSVQTQEEVDIQADPRIDYDSVTNIANSSDSKYSNYDMLWQPFKDEYDKKGVVCATPSSPSKIGLDWDYDESKWLHVSTTTKFSSSQVMQGASVGWWRSPFHTETHEGDTFQLRLRIFRVNNPQMTNQTSSSDNPEQIDLNEKSNPVKIFDSESTIVEQGEESLKYIQESRSIPDSLTDKNIEYNFTYMRANAPIYSEENYQVVWSYMGKEPNMFVSSEDVGGDENIRTHTTIADNDNVDDKMYESDFDTSVLFSSGISDHVTGITSDSIFDMNEDVNFEWTRTFDGSALADDEYLTVNIPFLQDYDTTVTISIIMTFRDDDENKLGTMNITGEYNDFLLDSVSHSALENITGSVSSIDYIDFDMSTAIFDDLNDFTVSTDTEWIDETRDTHNNNTEVIDNKMRIKYGQIYGQRTVGRDFSDNKHFDTVNISTESTMTFPGEMRIDVFDGGNLVGSRYHDLISGVNQYDINMNGDEFEIYYFLESENETETTSVDYHTVEYMDMSYEFHPLRLWLYDWNNNYTTSYEYSSMVATNKTESVEYGFQVYHSITISEGKWAKERPIEYYEIEKYQVKRDTGINWRQVRTVAEHTALWSGGAYGVAASAYMYSNYGNTPPSEVMYEWAKSSGKALVDHGANMIQYAKDIGFWIGQKISEVVDFLVEAIIYYGSALINLFVVLFSISTYVIFVAVTIKVSFGLLILVTKGIEPMFMYYSAFMDNIIGMSEKAVSMLPVI